MILKELLKQKRIQLGLTQEQMAQRLDRDTNTINNWENGSCTPNEKDSMEIAKAYGIEREEYLKARNDAVWPEEEKIPEDFPACLFSDAGMEKMKRLVFTPQETEMIRMLHIYNGGWKTSETESFSINEMLQNLPGEYINRIGVTEAQRLAFSINEKLGGDDNIQKAIEDELSSPENATIDAFNVFHASADCLYVLVKFCGKRGYGESGYRFIDKNDTNVFSYDLIKAVDNVEDGKTLVFNEDDIRFGDTGLTKKLMDDIDSIRENPAILVKDEEFAKDFSELFDHITEQVMKDMEACFKDGWLQIINDHVEFTNLLNNRKHCYNFADDALICGRNQSSPFPDWVVFSYEGEEGHRKCTASLTEKGKKLHEYIKNHEKESN